MPSVTHLDQGASHNRTARAAFPDFLSTN
jgi:hypothetical protein